MSSRTSTPLVAVLALLVLGVLAWLALGIGRRDEPHRADTGASADGSEAPAARPDGPALGEVAPARSDRPTRAQPAVEIAEGPGAAELADAVWVEGRVVLPEGTPADERVVVVAAGREFGSKKLHRAPLAADGTFRVAFAPKTKRPSLRLEARYVFLDEPNGVALEGERTGVVLTPLLGGAWRGRVTLDPAQERFAPELVGAAVAAQGWKPGMKMPAQKATKLGADLTFELGGIDPGIDWRVSCSAKGFATTLRESAHATVGKVEELELPMARGASVRGTVRDEQGAPVAGARLHTDARVRGAGVEVFAEVHTDAEGRFTLEELRPGPSWIVVQARGFRLEVLEQLALSAGEERELGGVVLARGLSIAGQARFADGTPAADVSVSAKPNEEPKLPHGVWFPRDDPAVKADAEGRFTITGLEAGAHLVTARSGLKETGEAASGTKRAPRVRFEDRRADVPAGTSDLVLVLDSGTSVTGRVVDDLGAAVPAFKVVFERRGAEPWQTEGRKEVSSRERDGGFQVASLPDGTWSVAAETKDGGRSTSHAITLPGPVVPLQLVVPRVAKLRGTVLDPSGAPVAGAALRFDREDDKFRFWSNENDAPKTDEHGAFEATVRPGLVHASAEHSGWAPSERQDVDIQPASSAGPLTLRLRLGGTIAGRALTRDGRPDAGRRVSVWGDGTSHQRIADSEGRFRFEHVPAGQVHVQLNPNEAELAATREATGDVDWEAAKPLNANARVEVVEGQVVEVELGGTPRDGVRVHGVVRPPAPAGRFRLTWFGPHGNDSPQTAAATADLEGRYEVFVAQAGRYGLSIQHPGGSNSTITVDVPPGREFTFDVVLPSGSVRGLVLDARGAPLAGAGVHTVPAKWTGDADRGRVVSCSAEAGADGTFLLSGLSEGTYQVIAQPGGRFEDGRWVQSRLSATMRDVAVSQGAAVEGIVLRMPGSGKVHGTVRGRDGVGVAGAEIVPRSLDVTDGFSVGGNTTASDGSFEIELVPGRYSVLAARNGAAAQRVDVVVREGALERIDLTLEPGNRLLVFCEGAAGRTSQVRIELLDAWGRHRGELTAGMFGADGPAGTPDAAGDFRSIPDGEYVVRARKEGSKPVEERVSLKGGVAREIRLGLPE